MKKAQTNLLVGCEVLIDWPMRWKSASEQFQQQCRDEAQAKEAHFGEYGVIMAYNPNREDGKEFTVKLTTGPHAGELVSLFYGALTVIKMPPEDRTEQLLEAILEAITTNITQKP